MARPIKISSGDLFAKGKTKVACVLDLDSDDDEVEYFILKGKDKGEYNYCNRSNFLQRYPNRVDKIVIE